MRMADTILADVDAVRDQLCQAVSEIAMVETYRQAHPFGSTLAVEPITHVELENLAVAIPLETELLPVKACVRVLKDGVLFRAACSLREVYGNLVTYAVELVR